MRSGSGSAVVLWCRPTAVWTVVLSCSECPSWAAQTRRESPPPLFICVDHDCSDPSMINIADPARCIPVTVARDCRTAASLNIPSAVTRRHLIMDPPLSVVESTYFSSCHADDTSNLPCSAFATLRLYSVHEKYMSLRKGARRHCD